MNLNVNQYLAVLTPATVLILMYFFKSSFNDTIEQQLGMNFRLDTVDYIFLIILTLSTTLSINPIRSLGLSIALFVNISLIRKIVLSQGDAIKLMRNLARFTIALSLFGIIEYLISNNPIYGSLFLNGPNPIVQYWSVYRITTLIGHPLANATFFSFAALLFFASWSKYGTKTFLIAAITGTISLQLTSSRASSITFGICLLYFLATSFQGRAIDATINYRKLIFFIINILIIPAGYLLFKISSRNASLESLQSKNARVQLLDVVGREIHFLVGTGIGTTQEYLKILRGQGLIVESSALELLLGLGVLGTLILVGLISMRVFELLRTKSVAFLPIIQVLGSSLFYNFIEGNRNGLILIGLSFLLRFT